MEKKSCSSGDVEVRKGPWTMEEDMILINYIANHGEGVWNSLAKSAGLKRTGKSCRLRWLNYLRPDVRRGNITPEEQLIIMELHAKWGNRWSKIAKHLPGRTDNEIKNFWRTRIQKYMKQTENSSTNSNNSGSHQSASADQMNSNQACSSTSGVLGALPPSDQTMEAYSPSSYQAGVNVMETSYSVPMINNQQFAVGAGENYWSMEDLWSMQLLNTD